MPLWLLALLGAGAGGGLYLYEKHASSGPAVNAATQNAMAMHAAKNSALLHLFGPGFDPKVAAVIALQNPHLDPKTRAFWEEVKYRGIHLFSIKLDQNLVTVAALKNPNLTAQAKAYWMARTAENPYFSKGAPGSIALGWG